MKPGAMCSEAYKLGIEAATVRAEYGAWHSAQHCLPLSQCTHTHSQSEQGEELNSRWRLGRLSLGAVCAS